MVLRASGAVPTSASVPVFAAFPGAWGEVAGVVAHGDGEVFVVESGVVEVRVWSVAANPEHGLGVYRRVPRCPKMAEHDTRYLESSLSLCSGVGLQLCDVCPSGVGLGSILVVTVLLCVVLAWGLVSVTGCRLAVPAVPSVEEAGVAAARVRAVICLVSPSQEPCQSVHGFSSEVWGMRSLYCDLERKTATAA